MSPKPRFSHSSYPCHFHWRTENASRKIPPPRQGVRHAPERAWWRAMVGYSGSRPTIAGMSPSISAWIFGQDMFMYSRLPCVSRPRRPARPDICCATWWCEGGVPIVGWRFRYNRRDGVIGDDESRTTGTTHSEANQNTRGFAVECHRVTATCPTQQPDPKFSIVIKNKNKKNYKKHTRDTDTYVPRGWAGHPCYRRSSTTGRACLLRRPDRFSKQKESKAKVTHGEF